MTSHTAFEALLVDEGLPAAGKSLTTRPNSVGSNRAQRRFPHSAAVVGVALTKPLLRRGWAARPSACDP